MKSILIATSMTPLKYTCPRKRTCWRTALLSRRWIPPAPVSDSPSLFFLLFGPIMAILSWNCHGFHQHATDLRDLINHYHPICIALQETLLHEAKTAEIRHYSIFRKDHVGGDRPSGGVALLTYHDYPCNTIPLQTDLQAVAIRIHIRTLMTICCLYLPPSINISQNSLNNLISQLPKPFIILGDMNGHSPLCKAPIQASRRIRHFGSKHVLVDVLSIVPCFTAVLVFILKW